MAEHAENIVDLVALAIAKSMPGWNDDTEDGDFTYYWEEINESALKHGRGYAVAALEALADAGIPLIPVAPTSEVVAGREELAAVIERGWGNPAWNGTTLRPIDRQLADAVLESVWLARVKAAAVEGERKTIAEAIWDDEQRCGEAIADVDPDKIGTHHYAHLNGRLLGLQRARDIAADISLRGPQDIEPALDAALAPDAEEEAR
ncbi:hypothetical protein ACFVAJ_17840 [Agromyces sp. NPDC057679]|uniref:hypothetical protein n=1 Tax=Agromyces sp. NPDC057679 TaxID=3346207 RepID=UPI0036728E69